MTARCFFCRHAIAGSYTFTFRASGFTRDGEPVNREAVRSEIRVEGRAVAPAMTPPPALSAASRQLTAVRFLRARSRNHLQRFHTEVMPRSSGACGCGTRCALATRGCGRFALRIRRTGHSGCCFASLWFCGCGTRRRRHHSHDLDFMVRMRLQVHRRGRDERQCRRRFAGRSHRSGISTFLGFSILEHPRSGRGTGFNAADVRNLVPSHRRRW